jgi:hypothetical protein
MAIDRNVDVAEEVLSLGFLSTAFTFSVLTRDISWTVEEVRGGTEGEEEVDFVSATETCEICTMVEMLD